MSFTRDFVNVQAIPALDNVTFDGSCGGSVQSGATAFYGHIIDRLAVGRGNYQVVSPNVTGMVDMGTSTAANTKYASVWAKVQHSNTTSTSATGALGWVDLTTGYQSCEQPVWQFGASTGSLGIPSSCSNAGWGYASTVGGCSSSTGNAALQTSPSWYPLDQAQQFIRIVVTPRIEGATSSGGGVANFSGALIFGSPAYAGVGSPVQFTNLGGAFEQTTSTGNIIRTTAT